MVSFVYYLYFCINYFLSCKGIKLYSEEGQQISEIFNKFFKISDKGFEQTAPLSISDENNALSLLLIAKNQFSLNLTNVKHQMLLKSLILSANINNSNTSLEIFILYSTSKLKEAKSKEQFTIVLNNILIPFHDILLSMINSKFKTPFFSNDKASPLGYYIYDKLNISGNKKIKENNNIYKMNDTKIISNNIHLVSFIIDILYQKIEYNIQTGAKLDIYNEKIYIYSFIRLIEFIEIPHISTDLLKRLNKLIKIAFTVGYKFNKEKNFFKILKSLKSYNLNLTIIKNFYFQNLDKILMNSVDLYDVDKQNFLLRLLKIYQNANNNIIPDLSIKPSVLGQINHIFTRPSPDKYPFYGNKIFNSDFKKNNTIKYETLLTIHVLELIVFKLSEYSNSITLNEKSKYKINADIINLLVHIDDISNFSETQIEFFVYFLVQYFYNIELNSIFIIEFQEFIKELLLNLKGPTKKADLLIKIIENITPLKKIKIVTHVFFFSKRADIKMIQTGLEAIRTRIYKSNFGAEWIEDCKVYIEFVTKYKNLIINGNIKYCKYLLELKTIIQTNLYALNKNGLQDEEYKILVILIENVCREANYNRSILCH
ncbi:hypothetical protein TCON_1643 [Astathelohania contejeani]|uniref:Uncharacterized protein n=1 Tax=Astathelohania contejeani TaxID=164912 RepID=A0ABQ7HYG0_9MICR|nr:hypothetical protein TCON_1643 [Thelohania contejeani]